MEKHENKQIRKNHLQYVFHCGIISMLDDVLFGHWLFKEAL